MMQDGLDPSFRRSRDLSGYSKDSSLVFRILWPLLAVLVIFSELANHIMSHSLLLALFTLESVPSQAAGSPIAKTAGPYRAPLYGANHPDKVPNAYLVMFKFNASHTLDQHWQTIGKDLSSSEGKRFHDLSCLSGYTISPIVSILVSGS